MSHTFDAGSAADLGALGALLGSLDDRDVAEHPGVLDEVHRAIVDELDTLGRTAAPRSGTGR